MSYLVESIANLPPEKRKLLELLLKEEGINLSGKYILPRQQSFEPIPLTFAQQRLWFLDQLEPNSAVYNIPFAVRIKGRLDVRALLASFNAVVARHEILRTTFSTQGDQSVQIVANRQMLVVPVVDISVLPDVQRESQAQLQAELDASTPFNLQSGPLVRATLLVLGEQEQMVLVTLHHIIADGWSVGILIEELVAAYVAFNQGKPLPLAPLAIQYADFAHWEREWLQGEILANQLAYWREQLKWAPKALDLPSDRPRPLIRTFHGAHYDFSLPENLTNALVSLGHQAGCTLFMTLLAAFKVLLARYSGERDVCVGTPVANRSRGEVQKLIGLFVNTLVLRSKLTGNPTFLEFLDTVRETTLEAFAQQDLPFEKLVEELVTLRDMSHTPLFQVMFAMHDASGNRFEVSDLEFELVSVEGHLAKFDITLNITEINNCLKASFEYNTDLFNASTIANMASHWTYLLEQIAAQPGSRLGDLCLPTYEDRHKLLVSWNASETHYPQIQCLHELFEAQAEISASAVAVVFENQKLTYQELNEQANQLAHYLISRGVGADVVVALCLDRSIDMVLVILAILKAGGAYMPLDSEYPKERLAFMLADSGAQQVITQSHMLGRLPVQADGCLCIDREWPQVATQMVSNPSVSVTPHNLAYVIYTSGSTGVPKAVMITHRAVGNLVHWHKSMYGIVSDDKATHLAGIGFDASVWEMCLTSVRARHYIWSGKNTGYLLQSCMTSFSDIALLLASYQRRWRSNSWKKTLI